VLNDIAFGNGPIFNLIALGYSSWSPKQLENEIINNYWLVAEATPELLFKTPDDDKWQRAIDEMGFDVNRICNRTGHA
jgi:putative transcriptional regulator